MNFIMNIAGNDDRAIIREIYIPTNTKVKVGDLIFEIESSKTVVEIFSEYEGLLSHSLEIGQEIRSGEVIFRVFNDSILDWQSDQNIDLTYSNNSVISKTEKLSIRKQSEINNLLSLNHSASTSVISILIELPGNRIVTPPFIFKDSISDILVFEAAKLLNKYRELNAYYSGNGFYEAYENVNFGWAFDSGDNLKVININNADKISLPQLQNLVFDLMKMYEEEEKLPIELVVGSTVTFTDLSRTEVETIIPLINGQQSLILGLTRVNRSSYRINAAYDHRISSGLTVTKFLSELKKRIISYYADKDNAANLACHVCEKSMAEELSLRHRGFIKITLPNGDDANLCRNCFEGW